MSEVEIEWINPASLVIRADGIEWIRANGMGIRYMEGGGSKEISHEDQTRISEALSKVKLR